MEGVMAGVFNLGTHIHGCHIWVVWIGSVDTRPADKPSALMLRLYIANTRRNYM